MVILTLVTLVHTLCSKMILMHGKIPWTKDNVITLYDQVCEAANETFPKFMMEAFHCPKSRSDVIAAG